MLSYALEQAEKPKNRDYSCKRRAPFKSAPTVSMLQKAFFCRAPGPLFV